MQASVLGTAAYLAPELMRGSKMSTASDIYSFGILSEWLPAWPVPSTPRWYVCILPPVP